MKTLFRVNGELVETVKEVNTILGRKVTKKDILEGNVPEVEVTSDVEEIDKLEGNAHAIQAELEAEVSDKEEEAKEDVENAEEETTEEGSTEEDTTEEDNTTEGRIVGNNALVEDENDIEEDSAEAMKRIEEAKARMMANRADAGTADNVVVLHPKADKPSLDELRAQLRTVYNRKVAENPELAKGTRASKDENKYDDNITEFPEKGTIANPEDLKKFYKKLSDAKIDEWLELEGIEYAPNDNPGINRMRKCMAIMNYHFPKEPSTSKKKKSKYGDYSTEDLVGMALENNIAVKDDKGDPRILRMYTVMALKDAGILK